MSHNRFGASAATFQESLQKTCDFGSLVGNSCAISVICKPVSKTHSEEVAVCIKQTVSELRVYSATLVKKLPSEFPSESTGQKSLSGVPSVSGGKEAVK